MSLIVEVFQKIRQLLDKPISVLTRNQIVQLLNKQVTSADDAAVLFAKKYRADLLLYLIAAQPVTPDKLQYLLGMLTDKLLQFKMDQAASLWKIILNKQEMKAVRQTWTEKLLKEALKNTNQSLKSAQLQLLKSNANWLWEWNQSRIFEDFAKNYCMAFIKFNIYLAPYASLLTLLFSKAEAVETSLIDNDVRRELLCRLIQFLNTTKNKQQFLFQNQCLKACSFILTSKRTYMNDVIVLYACDKMLEEYLWRKPTREEAYACKQALKRVRQAAEKENKDKMCRNYDPVDKQPEKPMLIEEVIDKVNGYRKNNHLIINQSSIEKSPKGTYLKRGVGNGGGKSVIVNPPTKKSAIGLSDLDELVQSCFRTSNDSFISKPKEQSKQNNQQNQYFEASMNASTVTIEEDKDFEEISNLIDLAFQFKFDLQYNA